MDNERNTNRAKQRKQKNLCTNLFITTISYLAFFPPTLIEITCFICIILSVLSRHPRFGGNRKNWGWLSSRCRRRREARRRVRGAEGTEKRGHREARGGVGSGERGIRTAPIMRGFRVT